MPSLVHLGTAVAIALVAACSRPEPTPAERALRDYVRAVQAGDCEKAWMLTSERMRSALEYLECRNRGGMAAKTMLCNEGAFVAASAEHPKTLSQAPGRARIAIQYEEQYGPALPGFSGVLTRDRDQPFDVVLEGALWKVEEPFVVERVERERAVVREELERMVAQHDQNGLPVPAKLRDHCALRGGEPAGAT